MPPSTPRYGEQDTLQTPYSFEGEQMDLHMLLRVGSEKRKLVPQSIPIDRRFDPRYTDGQRAARGYPSVAYMARSALVLFSLSTLSKGTK